MQEDLKLKPFKNKEVALSNSLNDEKKSGWWKKELRKNTPQ